MAQFYKKLTGSPVWLDCGSEKNTLHCFMTKFKLKTVPEKAVAAVSAETVYRLYVNGRTVVCEGPAHRESKPGCGWYDELDLSGYLQEGENVIAAQVWYWGNGGRNNVAVERGGFLFACSALRIAPEDWHYSVQPAVYTLTEDTTSGLYGGYDIGWDARKALPTDWINGDPAGFGMATVLGEYPCKPFGPLFRSPLEPFVYEDVSDYVAQARTDFVIEAGEFNHELCNIECTLPAAEQFYPYFCVKAPAGEKIGIQTDRRRTNGGPGDEHNVYKGHRIEYITAEGLNEFDSYDWLYGERVIYTLPKSAEIVRLGWRRTGNAAKAVGTFQSDDALLNTLVKKSVRTLQVCMRGNYMDCPDRERGQWIGDVSTQIPQTFFALDRTADALTKKAIYDFISNRDGFVLRGCVPGNHAGELPSQSLNAISDIGMLMTYCFYTGDLAPIKDAYEPIRNYLSLWQFNQNGEIIPRNGNWRWFDHKSGVDAEVLEYAWLCCALKAAIAYARLFNNKRDYISYTMSYDLLRQVADAKFWDGKGYKSGETYDDRAQAMAILSGIATGPKITRCARLLNDVELATPYMENYILEAMFAAGMDDEAVARLLRRYTPLAKNENSTLWEDFKVLGTRNHAWSGAPLTIACKWLAGISPLLPGFKRVLIAPSAAAPNNMDCTLQIPQGTLSVRIRRGPDGYAIEVKMPRGCTAVVGLPISVIGNGKVKGAVPYEHDPHPRAYGAEFDTDFNAQHLLADDGEAPLCARKMPLTTHRLVLLKKSGTVYCEYE